MVTRSQMEALRAQRSTPKATPELTPDGTAFGQIRASQDRAREDSIAAIERAFKDARRDIRREYELARRQGQTRQIFNQLQGVKL